MKQFRRGVVTINLTESEDPYSVVPEWGNYPCVKRVTGQLERGEETKRMHWQLFIELKYPVSKKYLIEYWPRVWGWGSEGHVVAGRRYVQKETEFPNSRFTWPDENSTFNKVKEMRALEKMADEGLTKLIFEKDGGVEIKKNKESIIQILKANIELCRKKIEL